MASLVLLDPLDPPDHQPTKPAPRDLRVYRESEDQQDLQDHRALEENKATMVLRDSRVSKVHPVPLDPLALPVLLVLQTRLVQTKWSPFKVRNPTFIKYLFRLVGDFHGW